MGKRILSFVLALMMAGSLSANFLPVGAYAETVSPQASPNQGDDISIVGNDALGTMLAEDLASENARASGNDAIVDLSVDGHTAAVTYRTTQSADLVVAIYDENNEKMLASGTTAVSPTPAGDTVEAAVAIEGTIPAYFIARAFLLDATDHGPLCDEYTTYLYTQNLQDFLTKTTEDFDPDLLLNLDEDTSTNFTVFNVDTERMSASEQTDVLTNNGDGTYTITSATDQFKQLEAGDTFSYEFEDGTVLLVKAASVTVQGDTVTVIEDEQADLTDFFDYVRIEEDSEGKNITFDDSTEDEDLTYIGETEVYANEPMPVALGAWEDELKYSHKLTWKLDKTEKANDKEDDNEPQAGGDVKLTGSITYSFGVKVHYYISGEYTEVSLKTDNSLEAKIELTGKLDTKVPLRHIEIPVLGILSVGMDPSFVIESSGKVSFSGKVEGSTGVQYIAGEGFKDLSEEKKPAEFKVSFEGSLFIGIECTPSLAISFFGYKPVELSLEATVGAEATGKQNIWESTDDSRHPDGAVCIDGEVSIKLEVAPKMRVFKKDDIITAKFSIDWKAGEFYWCINNGEFGWGKCPHIEYKISIEVVDNNGGIKGATIEGTKDITVPETDENGKAEFYLPNGDYTLTVTEGDREKIYYLTVKDDSVSVTIKLEPAGKPEPAPTPGPTPEPTPDPNVLADGDCGENLTWVLYRDGSLVVSGDGPMYVWNNSDEIPWYAYMGSITSVEIKDGATDVGKWAFMGARSLTNVKLGNTIETIGWMAFRDCDGLTTVKIPESVTALDEYAFGYCSGLRNIDIPGTIQDIGDFAFYDCGLLEELTLGEGIVNIGTSVFDHTAVKKVVLPSTLAAVGERMFSYCTNLTEVEIKKGPTSIGQEAFNGCKLLSSVNVPDGITSIGTSAFASCSNLSSISIPDTVNTIKSHAFSYTAITELPNLSGVTSISDSVFYGCDGLTDITIPAHITYIGDDAFYLCTALKNIRFTGDAPEFYFNTKSGVHTIFGSFMEELYITAYYPQNNATWADIIQQPFAGNVTWIAYDPSATISAEAIIDSSVHSKPKPAASPIGNPTDINPLSLPVEEHDGTVNGDEVMTATFSGLVPGSSYVLIAVKSLTENPLTSPENLLYIAQRKADANGVAEFTYIPRTGDAAQTKAYGATFMALADCEITLSVESFAYDGSAKLPAITVWDGEDYLIEGVDYTVTATDNVNVGTATITITGLGGYTGSVQKTFVINKAKQTITTSVPSTLTLGQSQQLTVNAFGNLHYSVAPSSVITISETGVIKAVGIGTATITIAADGNTNYDPATLTITVTVVAAGNGASGNNKDPDVSQNTSVAVSQTNTGATQADVAIPRTGDDSLVEVWLALLMISVCGLTAVGACNAYRRKKKNK